MRGDTHTPLRALALLLCVLCAGPALCAPQTPAETKPSSSSKVNKERREQWALYQKFLDNFRGGPAEQKNAYKAARKYLKKYGKHRDPDDVKVADYLRHWTTRYEEAAAEFERRKKALTGVGLGQPPGGVGTGDGTPPKN
jgi:hypothetical protein